MMIARPFARTVLPAAPIYLVMRDFGPLGFESVTLPEQTKDEVISDIASGQIDRVSYVLEIFPREGTSRDVTDEIVEAVAALQQKAA